MSARIPSLLTKECVLTQPTGEWSETSLHTPWRSDVEISRNWTGSVRTRAASHFPLSKRSTHTAGGDPPQSPAAHVPDGSGANVAGMTGAEPRTKSERGPTSTPNATPPQYSGAGGM